MKRFLTVLLLLLLTIIPFRLEADQEPEDMSVFTIKILLQHCDQSDEIKVVKLKNTLTGRDGFCIEPHVNYKPSINEYYKVSDHSKVLYDLNHAYEVLGKTDEAFITIQLMIWEELFDEEFTFEGKDASDYLKDEVLEILAQDETQPEIISEETDVGEIRQLTVDDLSKYNIISDLYDIETDGDILTYCVSEYTDEILKIELEPKSPVPDGAFIYDSEGSQDIYAFEGEYEPLIPKTINIKVNSTDLSISFRKLDLNQDPIKGAEFTLYRIDPQAQDDLYFLKAGSSVDLFSKLVEDIGQRNREDLSISVSERYSAYLQDGTINTSELGYFPFEIKDNGSIISEGRVYVTDDIDEDFVGINVETIKTVSSTDEQINQINGLKPANRYYLCESEPQRGYTYVDKPCQIIDTNDDSYLDEHIFYNDSRSYTLRLIKNNPEKTIALNGAVFRLSYTDKDDKKEYTFKTGSLNIFNEGGFRYAIYRYEGSDEAHIVEFNSDSYIEDEVPYGKYEYYLSNDNLIDPEKFDKETIVQEGTFIIDDLPYSASLRLEELQAPKGYFIDEAIFELTADISYGDITFTNSRVNSFDIIPNNRRKIPKTCIGD